MRCRDVMHRTMYVCSPTHTVKACADVMRAREIPALMVLDDGQRLVGIVNRDAVLAASWRRPGAPVSDVMNQTIVRCAPDDTAAEAALRLRRNRAPAALVTDGETILGWLAPSDLARGARSLQRHRPRRRRQRKERDR